VSRISRLLKTPLIAAAALLFSTVTGVGAAEALATPAPAAVAHFSYQGSAYGTKVNVGNVLTSGRSALVTLGCTDVAGLNKTNTAAALDLAPLLASGTVATSAQTFASPVAARTIATTQQVNLLTTLAFPTGLVHADAVRAESTTTYTGTGFTTRSTGTNLANLVVAGIPITATPAPNTRIDLPGFGYVILNEQSRTLTATSASLSVNAIHLVITGTNRLGIAPNTNVIVSHADSGLGGPVAGTLDGIAYGSSATVGSLVTAGRTFPISMPCLGTNGRLRTNTGVGVTVPGLLTTGTITDTARGTVDANAATGEMTSTVDDANVLTGLVTATLITADAHASTDGSTFKFRDTGSTFATLSVAGFPGIDANVAANTQITVPNVGTLYLHRVIRTAHSIEVRMIELVLTNVVNGLPVGTDVRVAVAEASAH
jgi:hypothetical protein